MKHNKKWLALLITLSMVLSLVPATVMADAGRSVADAPAYVSNLAMKDPETPGGDAEGQKANVPTFTKVEDATDYIASQIPSRPVGLEFIFELDTPIDTTNKTAASEYLGNLANQILENLESVLSEKYDGDYFRYQMGHSIGWGYAVSTAATSISFHYTPRYMTTAAEDAEVEEAMDNVIASLNLTSQSSEYERFMAVYDYIVKNVFYDEVNKTNDEYLLKLTAYAALVNGTAVCQGYANLLFRMLQKVQIESRIISGMGTNSTGSEGHAWNIVKIDGKWYNVDATWDSSGCFGITGSDSTARIYPMDWCLKSDEDFPRHARFTEYTGTFAETHPISSTSYNPTQPLFLGHQVLISDDIAVTYLVYFPTSVTSDNVLHFTLSDGRSFDANGAADPGMPGCYWYKCNINAMEIADTITATVNYGTDGQVTNTYSVLKYCNTIRNNPATFSTKAIALVNAIQDYGHYLEASGWTDNNRHADIPAVTDEADISAATSQLKSDPALAQFAFRKPTMSVVKSAMFSLVLQSTTSIKMYYQLEGAKFSDETVMIGEEEYQVGFIKRNIGPTELDNWYNPLDSTAAITAESGQVCALSYVYSVLNSTKPAITQAKRNAVVALYYYYLAAEAFIA